MTLDGLLHGAKQSIMAFQAACANMTQIGRGCKYAGSCGICRLMALYLTTVIWPKGKLILSFFFFSFFFLFSISDFTRVLPPHTPRTRTRRHGPAYSRGEDAWNVNVFFWFIHGIRCVVKSFFSLFSQMQVFGKDEYCVPVVLRMYAALVALHG